ncbi:ATP-dependent nuclease [Pseudomonas oryzihabitans]|uniref:ATP-dependent nuclease n=1 Tax=Pseudomonas oryzihabitans TaxID=47885 RepID=UPI003CEF5FAD
MIKLISAEIENFRSITSKPLNVQFKEFTSIIGPNNCGKSNILRSLQLFFTGGIEDKKYDTEIDFPKNPLLPKHAQTKITVTVSYEPNKETILERALTELEAQKIQRRLDNDLITLRLSYSKNGVESWQFIGKLGSRNINKEAIYRIRDALRQSVIFKYLPIGRDSIDSVTEEIGSDLIRTIFSGWSGAIKKRQEINESIFNLVSKLKPELESSSTSVTQSMAAVFPEIQNLELQLPFENLEQMLPSLKPVLKDSAETGLKSKGAGIQTSSLLFLLKYLADNYPQRFVRATFIWAIEEPESFLHPAKQRSMAKVLTDFSKEVQTIITTHCPHFVPRDTISSCCYVIDKDTAQPWSTEVISQNYTDARKSLGVTLLDSMSLYPINIVIEGPSDEIYLSEALKKYQAMSFRTGTILSISLQETRPVQLLLLNG